MPYTALSPIRCNGKKYGLGQPLPDDLSSDVIDGLMAVGAVAHWQENKIANALLSPENTKPELNYTTTATAPKASNWDDTEAVTEDKESGVVGGGETLNINVNTCTRDDLVNLQGIGETIADAIINGRVWESVKALTQIKGLSLNTLNTLKNNGVTLLV